MQTNVILSADMVSHRSLSGVGLLASASIFSALACNRPDFIKTSNDFVPTPRRGYPAVFLERAPDRPYQSVGIIQADGRLSEVVEAVKEKGKQVGCDVLVDRRIHPTEEASTSQSKMWVVRVLTGPSPRTEAHGDRPLRWSSPESRALFGSVPVPIVVPSVSVTAPQSHEFICGIFLQQDRAVTPPTTVLWEVFSQTKGLESPCEMIARVLAKESDCSGEQCVAPLVLSTVFIKRCEENLPTVASSVKEHQIRWESEAAKAGSGPCFGILLRATRSRSAAAEYRRQCLAKREGGHMEATILDRATAR